MVTKEVHRQVSYNRFGEEQLLIVEQERFEEFGPYGGNRHEAVEYRATIYVDGRQVAEAVSGDMEYAIADAKEAYRDYASRRESDSSRD